MLAGILFTTQFWASARLLLDHMPVAPTLVVVPAIEGVPGGGRGEGSVGHGVALLFVSWVSSRGGGVWPGLLPASPAPLGGGAWRALLRLGHVEHMEVLDARDFAAVDFIGGDDADALL